MGFENSLLHVLHVQLKGSVSLSRASHLRAIQGLVNTWKKNVRKMHNQSFLVAVSVSTPSMDQPQFLDRKEFGGLFVSLQFHSFLLRAVTSTVCSLLLPIPSCAGLGNKEMSSASQISSQFHLQSLLSMLPWAPTLCWTASLVQSLLSSVKGCLTELICAHQRFCEERQR